MKERPILFSAPMVRAILDGSKTQTRRICKTIKDPDIGCEIAPCEIRLTFANRLGDVCPFGTVGDRLWVRETFFKPDKNDPGFAGVVGDYIYRADYDYREHKSVIGDNHWKPSIFMPRRASRITLEITGVRVERLNEISRGDCMSEGCPFQNMSTNDPVNWYSDLWESINGPGSWANNHWVWVIQFKRISK